MGTDKEAKKLGKGQRGLWRREVSFLCLTLIQAIYLWIYVSLPIAHCCSTSIWRKISVFENTGALISRSVLTLTYCCDSKSGRTRAHLLQRVKSQRGQREYTFALLSHHSLKWSINWVSSIFLQGNLERDFNQVRERASWADCALLQIYWPTCFLHIIHACSVASSWSLFHIVRIGRELSLRFLEATLSASGELSWFMLRASRRLVRGSTYRASRVEKSWSENKARRGKYSLGTPELRNGSLEPGKRAITRFRSHCFRENRFVIMEYDKGAQQLFLQWR